MSKGMSLFVSELSQYQNMIWLASGILRNTQQVHAFHLNRIDRSSSLQANPFLSFSNGGLPFHSFLGSYLESLEIFDASKSICT